MSTPLPPSSVQEALINADFNGVLLEILFLGLYTMVYVGTLYVYLTKKTSRNWIVVGTISLSYIVYVVQTSVQWYILKWAFVSNGQTQETIFIAALNGPIWETLFDDICGFLLAVLADGLLIWRCFNVWDSSIQAILLPLFLLFCESAVYLSIIIIGSANKLQPSPNQAQILNTLTGSVLFMTLGTTLVSTLLISYRIHSVSKQDVLVRGSKTRFNHVLEILVQSAAAYSMVSLAYAVPLVLPVTDNNLVALNAAADYTSAFYTFIAGAAPTIMVARVAFGSDTNGDISTITHLSGLQFHGQSTAINAAQSRMDSTHVADENSPVQEFENLNEKEGATITNV